VIAVDTNVLVYAHRQDSEWHKRLELELPENWSLFKQPGGLEPNAENVENLPDGYYQNLVESNNADWVDVHVHAKYGKSLSGQAVFRASFKPDYHVTYEPLEASRSVPLMIAQDFGRTPASLICQVDNRGRLLVLKEVTAVGKGIEQFAVEDLRPVLLQSFVGHSTFMVADPSGRDKAQTTEESPFDVLKRLGFDVYAAPTNKIDPRLRAVEKLFLALPNPGAQLLIDGANCPQLVMAMKSYYRYKRKKTGELDVQPEKNHPWSDLADCLQYASLSTDANYVGKVIARRTPRQSSPPVSAAGWT
jgi:hypothetical protein